MFLASLILILSTAFFFFYFQTVCQGILRRRFDLNYFRVIVDVNRLGFLSVRQALEQSDSLADYPRLRMTLKCDFQALTYLLKNSAKADPRYSPQERLLSLYFRLTFLSMTARHLLRLREKPAILKLTAILQYFANLVGKRTSEVRFAKVAASDYLLSR